MNKLKYITLGIIVLLIAGCCKPCEKEDLGQFLLANETGGILDFTIIDSRVFTSNLNQQETFTYSPVSTGFEEMAANCNTESNCGFCCNNYQAGFAYTQFLSSNGTNVFDITVKKDFLQFEPTDDPNSITDYLTITFNNILTCELFDLPDVNLIGNVTLNDKTFTKVFSCELDAGAGNPGPASPTAFYFTVEKGIVGYKLGNGTTWSLND